MNLHCDQCANEFFPSQCHYFGTGCSTCKEQGEIHTCPECGESARFPTLSLAEKEELWIHVQALINYEAMNGPEQLPNALQQTLQTLSWWDGSPWIIQASFRAIRESPAGAIYVRSLLDIMECWWEPAPDEEDLCQMLCEL